MTKIQFDDRANKDTKTENLVRTFLKGVTTLEIQHDMPVIIFQDGASNAYYIKSSLLASDAAKLCDLDAKLDIASPDSYRANRELFLKHMTYQRMVADAIKGRDLNPPPNLGTAIFSICSGDFSRYLSLIYPKK